MTDCSLLEPEAKMNPSSLKLLSSKYIITATGKGNKTLGSKTCVSYCDKMPEEDHLKRKDLILLTVLEDRCMVELAPFPRTNGDLEHNGGECDREELLGSQQARKTRRNQTQGDCAKAHPQSSTLSGQAQLPTSHHL